MSVGRQAELLGVSRASFYYESRVNENDLRAMEKIDAIFTKSPFYGSRKVRHGLKTLHGITLGRDHVRRLMTLLGLETIYPKTKQTSLKNPNHKLYRLVQ